MWSRCWGARPGTATCSPGGERRRRGCRELVHHPAPGRRLLLGTVPTARIVTALVLFSQFGLLGYLLAPAVGGPLAQAYGFPALALVPAVATAALGLLAVVVRRTPATTAQPAAPGR